MKCLLNHSKAKLNETVNDLFYINGLVQDCSISIANVLELLQSCTKQSDGLVQDCSNSIAKALQLPQSCTKLPIYLVCNTIQKAELIITMRSMSQKYFHHNRNPMANLHLFIGHIATIFCTWYYNSAVMPCAKLCRDHFTRIWIRAKPNFHWLSIVMW